MHLDAHQIPASARWRVAVHVHERDGEQFVESLTLVRRGDKVLRTGRDNFNNNLTSDLTIDGESLVFRGGPHQGSRLVMDPSGRLMDGELKMLASNSCVSARYTCRRR